jgi:outer membrane protein OmpA-like peptidoglycan-associated protein
MRDLRVTRSLSTELAFWLRFSTALWRAWRITGGQLSRKSVKFHPDRQWRLCGDTGFFYPSSKGGYGMRRMAIILLAATIVGWRGFSIAGDLAFPKTEADIVKALKLKDGNTTFNGTEYLSEKGNVYKIIGGKRYQLRGLESIVDSDIVPKAGALIHFDFDSAGIKPDSYPLLDEYGKALRGGLSEAVIAVAGHTDSKGTDEYNLGLSEKRANAIKEYLITKHGIAPERILVKAYGKNQPIASNDTPDGQALNRRVEFIRIGSL